MQIKITNNIEKKVTEYQQQTGATKKWIADKIGISKQRLYSIFNSDNLMLDVLIRFSLFLNCNIEDLFTYEIIDE